MTKSGEVKLKAWTLSSKDYPFPSQKIILRKAIITFFGFSNPHCTEYNVLYSFVC